MSPDDGPLHQAKDPASSPSRAVRKASRAPKARRVAVVTGGDSGIGRAVAVAYAREGADVALLYLNEFEDADETRRQIFVYSLILVALGLAPAALGFAGWLYLVVSTSLGAVFLHLAWRLKSGSGQAIGPVAKRLFAFSILYLFALFAALLAERLAGLPGFGA